MRLIDADRIPFTKGHINRSKKDSIIALKEDIDKMPVIDPVRHGHWIKEEDDDMAWWVCSECNVHFVLRSNYCPYCGAEMERK